MKDNLRKIITTFLAAVIICFIFSGCKKENDEGSNGRRRVVDMEGKEKEISDNINKIFVDWPDGIILTMTLGATGKLVAVPNVFDSDVYAWTGTICPEINSIERNDEAYMSLDEVLLYEPELVITTMREMIPVYEEAGLEAIYVSFDDNMTFQEALKIVGQALGEKEYRQAEKYCEYYEANVKMITEHLGSVEELSKPLVYYVDGRFTDIYHTVGSGECQENWIMTAGGILATSGEYDGKNFEISADKMLEINPDYILIGQKNQADIYNELIGNAALSELAAVKNHRVCRIPQGLLAWCRSGPESALQIVWTAKLLYPDRFEDIDIKEITKNFYQDFFGTDVSDEILEGILSGKLGENGK